MALSISAQNDCEDRISELPDDILVPYMLPTDMKEATKTSIISKRWRYLWVNHTHLDFNHRNILPESDENLCSCFFTDDEKNKYINWVNQVLSLHRGPRIDTFRVMFTFDDGDVHHFNKWVTFALSKKVENLHLSSVLSETFVYDLGFDVLKPSLGVSFLKSLHLREINVSGDVLEYLLSHCHLLERLHVERSETVVRLRVVGLSCKLKQLTIRFCNNLEQLVIDAANLEYLEYASRKLNTNVVFKSMPLLVEAKFGGSCFVDSCSIIPQISHLAAQISTLHLILTWWGFPTGVFPTFSTLKGLTMQIDVEVQIDLAAINQILKACPTMCKLKLEIVWHCREPWAEAYYLQKVDLSRDNVKVWKDRWDYFGRIEGTELERTNLPNLKKLQVVGFNGCNGDVMLILFILLLAPNVETIVCDSRRCDGLISEEIIEASKSRAAKLVKYLPPHVSLEIL